LSCTPQHLKRRKHRNIALGYGRRLRRAAGRRLAAVRSAGGFLAVGYGCRHFFASSDG
jgi:hypothetical protein